MGTGVTKADFHSVGMKPCWIDELNILAIGGGANSGAQSRRIQFWDAVWAHYPLTLIFIRRFSTSLTDIV